MLFTTSICANYLPKALVLGGSLRKCIKNAVFVVCLVEREVPEAAAEAVRQGVFDVVVLGRDLGLDDDFNRFIFKHTIVEASTSVKGMLIKYLYQRFPSEDKLIYLDPDCKVFSDMPELWELMVQRPIVLCPHLLQPGHIEMEVSSIKYGVYNLGFLAVNRMMEAQNFIDWWAERLYLMCYDDLPNGLFTDQRWIDLAVTFFDVELLQHYGYDFGTWAIKDVSISKRDDTYYINDQPLRFAHFSGFDGGTIDMVKKWWLSDMNRDMYIELVDDYTHDLNENGHDRLGKLPWSYGRYYSGEPVFKETRIAYRNENKTRWKIDDPYKYSNQWFAKKFGIPINKDEPEWAKYGKKTIDIIVREGIVGLIKRTLNKLTCKIKKIALFLKTKLIPD